MSAWTKLPGVRRLPPRPPLRRRRRSARRRWFAHRRFSRPRRARPSSRRSRPSATSCRSRSAVRRTTDSGGHRTCCDTSFRTATRRRSSIARSRCSSRSWRRPGWPMPSGPDRRVLVPRDRATSRQRSVVRCGGGTAAGALLPAQRDGAPSAGCWNCTTSSRMPTAGRRRSGISSSDAAPTTGPRRSCGPGAKGLRAFVAVGIEVTASALCLSPQPSARNCSRTAPQSPSFPCRGSCASRCR